MRFLVIGLPLLALCACDRGAENSANMAQAQPQNAEGAVNYVAEVAKMPDAARSAVLFRAIRDAGLSCQNVVEAQAMEPQKNQFSRWRARCEDGKYHLIDIAPSGSAVVMSRPSP